MPKSHVSQTTARKTRNFQQRLLKWYDTHRRVLPWRALAGKKADPYHVWLSEIMLQQTTVQAVIPYFEKFTTTWPTVNDLAAADPDHVMHAWAGLGYYARARNLLKCAAEVCKNHKGKFPKTEAELQNLPGIGPYTSAAISAIAFGNQATVIDGNVDRVISRVCKIEEPLPLSKPMIRAEAEALYQDVERPGDFAQAMMDLGATICTPQSPKCGSCPVRDLCLAYEAGIQAELPRKIKKKDRPQRFGEVYWLTSGDKIIIEKRVESRMLGGMSGLPTTDWDKSGQTSELPEKIRKKLKKTGVVHHTFTHFDLTLDILEAELAPGALSHGVHWGGGWKFISLSDINNVGFPTVFKKVVKLMSSSLGIA